jgi:stage III sporulation protein AE
MTFLSASFFASIRIAADVTKELLGFMQVLLPAYFLALAAAGGALTSASVCGFTIGAIGVVQSTLSELLIPLMRIFMLMVMAGNLWKEDMISKLTELLGNFILWTMKTMFGVIVGFHVIQGMILPQADALKNASALKVAQMIPGIGGGLGAVSQIVMGSGILIKNTAGAAAVVILLILAAIPILKLAILMVLYYMAAAVMQPVCDKRLVSCMMGAATGHGLLLKLVGYSLALFVLTIAVLCVSTNAVWYAG